MPEKSHTPDENLQQEFNRWAEAGEGEKMSNHHLDITEKTHAATWIFARASACWISAAARAGRPGCSRAWWRTARKDSARWWESMFPMK